MKIGLVTCRKLPNLTDKDQQLIPLFHSRQIDAHPVIWNDPSIRWKEYHALIIRSIWDYHLHPDTFIQWLDLLEGDNVPTLNPIRILRKNHHKFYLEELENQGVDIVPTLFIKGGGQLHLSRVRDQGWEQAVIKPAISASAYLTELFETDQWTIIRDKYQRLAPGRDFLIQKFMPEIQSSGELSIIFINRKYSHAVLKTACSNEFRVQSEFGGDLSICNPEWHIIDTAKDILSKFDEDLLYARVDGVIHNNSFILMELELIEPDLFFDRHPPSIDLFVQEAMNLISRF